MVDLEALKNVLIATPREAGSFIDGSPPIPSLVLTITS
jgi:hypothetical protein